MLCTILACRNLTEPPGVNVSYSNNQDIGSIATYTCKELPHLMGKRICDATGWNKDEPKCGEWLVKSMCIARTFCMR